MTAILPRRSIMGQPDAIDGKVARAADSGPVPEPLTVRTIHQPVLHANGWVGCEVCSGRGLCHTFRTALLAQAEGDQARMEAAMTLYYLRAISRPGVRRLASAQLHAQLMDWIPQVVAAHLAARRKAEAALAAARREAEAALIAANRAAIAASTGARRAVANIVTWTRSQWESLLDTGDIPGLRRHRGQ